MSYPVFAIELTQDTDTIDVEAEAIDIEMKV